MSPQGRSCLVLNELLGFQSFMDGFVVNKIRFKMVVEKLGLLNKCKACRSSKLILMRHSVEIIPVRFLSGNSV
jgi:hypothetical protein